jgi:TonB-dependent SusC/RagA subfamily outer membrane receptor
MSRSSPLFPNRSPLAFPLLTGILLGGVAACARPAATTDQIEPAAAAPKDSAHAAALTSGDIEKRPQESVESLLRGRTSGVEVTTNRDGSISVRIQGASSFYSNTEPLYIIDGSPVTPGPGGALAGVSPHDIESIKVLKYPPETTLYGVRGANGVIVITTKRPKR